MSSKTEKSIVAAIDIGATYSGYAFSFKHEYEKDPTKVTINQEWRSSNWISLKTPTCVLYDSKGEFDSFGYDAENTYAILTENDAPHKWHLFRRFKMALYQKQTQNGFEVEDEKGLKMPARKVVGRAIRYLKEDLLRTLNQQYTADDIHWILTVPAIWTDSAKQLMREAADEAGIRRENLTIALEPGAAAMYCLPRTRRSDDSKYMVIDIGGDTVDITVHEKQRDGTINEVLKDSRGGCGGNIVNEEFNKLLIKIFGDRVLKTFCKRNIAAYMEMCEEFESKKRQLSTYSNANSFIRVPVLLINMYENSTGKSIQMATLQSPYGLKIQWRGDKMVFDADLFRSLFQNCISTITEYIANILDMPGVKRTSIFLMVGGFSECQLIQEAVMKAFPTVTVVKPREAELVVLKGAVILGHRICKACDDNFQLHPLTNKDHSTMKTAFDIEATSQNTGEPESPSSENCMLL